MRLGEFLGLAGIELVRTLPDQAHHRALITAMGVDTTAEASSFIVPVDAIGTTTRISIAEDLATYLEDIGPNGSGVLLVAKESLDRFPWPLLAQTVAAAGWTVVTLAQLDYTHVNTAILIVPGRASPWVNPALGPRDEAPSELQDYENRFLISLYALQRYATSPALPQTTDGENHAAAVFRERRRLEAAHLAESADAQRAFEAATESLETTSAELRSLRNSKRYLFGSMLAESVRRPKRAAKIARRLRTTEDLPEHRPPGPRLEVEMPTHVLTGLRQPSVEYGTDPVAIVAVAAPAAIAAWSKVATVRVPLRHDPLDVLETSPDLVVIQASALNGGRWHGVGQLADTRGALALLDLVDQAMMSGIPAVFDWDVLPGKAPGARQIARACAAVVTGLQAFIDSERIEYIPPALDVASSALAQIRGQVPTHSALAVDAEISLGSLPVRHVTTENLLYGPEDLGDDGLVWLGETAPTLVSARAGARGSAFVAASNPIGLLGADRPQSYRDIGPVERYDRAIIAIDAAQRHAVDNQRILFKNHDASLQLERFGQAAGVRIDTSPRIGILLKGDVGSSVVEDLLLHRGGDAGAVVVWDPERPSSASQGDVAVVSDVSAARAAIRSAPLDSWILIRESEGHLDAGHLILDASRMLSYGLDEVSFASQGEVLATMTTGVELVEALLGTGLSGGRTVGLRMSVEDLGWKL